MKISILVLILSAFLAFGCEKPEPFPELRDKIYQDFKDQSELAIKDLDAAEKVADDYKAQMQKAEPQTGLYKKMQKKYYEAIHRVDQMKQQVKYWKIHLEERVVSSRLSYSQAFADKKPWPDPEEFETYKAQKKLRTAKLQWDQKDRIKGMKMGSSPTPAGGGEGHGGGGGE